MKNTRITTANTGITSLEDFEKKVNEIARIQHFVEEENAKLKIKIDEETETSKIKIEDVEKAIEGDLALCESYARKYRKDLFHGKAKSAKTAHAIFGFNNPPEAVLFNDNETEETVIEKAKDLKFLNLIKTTEKFLKAEAKKLTKKDQEKIGIHTTSPERFFVKPTAEAVS